MLDMSIHYNDPLKEWDSIAETIVQLSNKKKSIQNREVLSNMLDSVADIHFYDLRGNEITSSSQILDELEEREVTQSYSVQYVFQIITKLIEQIRKLERKKYLMPVLSEFFPLYHSHWRPFEIRRKKDWCRILKNRPVSVQAALFRNHTQHRLKVSYCYPTNHSIVYKRESYDRRGKNKMNFD